MSEARSGMSFTSVLTLILIVLKLTGVFLYSWWWVFAALWIPAIILTSLVIIYGSVQVLINIYNHLK